MTNNLLRNVTILVPVGGMATRAREVTKDQIPKHLIRLGNGQTVLASVCYELQRIGFRRFVFCLGHHKDSVTRHISEETWISETEVEYLFVGEDYPLGVDGAILHAIDLLNLHGQAMLIPGDMMLPWDKILPMNQAHMSSKADITFGVTSYVTERTTDVGKFVVDNQTQRLLRCFARDEVNPGNFPGTSNLTSAALMCASVDAYVELCETYQTYFPTKELQQLSVRDQVLPWALVESEFNLFAYDVEAEILDLGTPSNIRYGQENWSKYVSKIH